MAQSPRLIKLCRDLDGKSETNTSRAGIAHHECFNHARPPLREKPLTPPRRGGNAPALSLPCSAKRVLFSPCPAAVGKCWQVGRIPRRHRNPCRRGIAPCFGERSPRFRACGCVSRHVTHPAAAECGHRQFALAAWPGPWRVLTRCRAIGLPVPAHIVEPAPSAMPVPSSETTSAATCIKRLTSDGLRRRRATPSALGPARRPAPPSCQQRPPPTAACGDGKGNGCGVSALMHGGIPSSLIRPPDETYALIVDHRHHHRRQSPRSWNTHAGAVAGTRRTQQPNRPTASDVLSRIRHRNDWEDTATARTRCRQAHRQAGFRNAPTDCYWNWPGIVRRGLACPSTATRP